MRIQTCLAASALAILLAGSVGRSSARGDDATNEIQIQISETGLEVVDLLRTVSAATQVPIAWSDQDKAVIGRRLVGPRTIRATHKGLFDTVRGLLAFYSLVLVPTGEPGREVWLVMDARQSTGLMRLKAEQVEINDENAAAYATRDGYFLTATIRVSNLRALRDARTALSRLITPNNIGSVTELPEARAFVVTDFAPSVVAAYRLIRSMDTAPAATPTEIGFFALQHARATNVARILEELFGDAKPTALPAQPVPEPQPGDIRFSADPDSNQVVVIAPPAVIASMRPVVARLDVVPPKAGAAETK